jgi:hypothetical protein
VNCYFVYGRWVAVVKKVKPGTCGARKACYGGRVFTSCKPFARFHYCSLERARWNGRDTPCGPESLKALKAYAESLLGTGLSAEEVEDLDFVLHAAEDFCLHRLDGGTIKGWFEGRGLKPLTRLFPYPGPENLKPLEIITGLNHHYLYRAQFFGAEEHVSCPKSPGEDCHSSAAC